MAAADVNIGGRQIVEALVAAVIVVLNEGGDGASRPAGKKGIFQQDADLQGLVLTDFVRWLGMARGSAGALTARRPFPACPLSRTMHACDYEVWTSIAHVQKDAGQTNPYTAGSQRRPEAALQTGDLCGPFAVRQVPGSGSRIAALPEQITAETAADHTLPFRRLSNVPEEARNRSCDWRGDRLRAPSAPAAGG